MSTFRTIKKGNIFMVVNQNGAIFYSGRSRTEAIKTQRTMKHRVAIRTLSPDHTFYPTSPECTIQTEMDF